MYVGPRLLRDRNHSGAMLISEPCASCVGPIQRTKGSAPLSRSKLSPFCACSCYSKCSRITLPVISEEFYFRHVLQIFSAQIDACTAVSRRRSSINARMRVYYTRIREIFRVDRVVDKLYPLDLARIKDSQSSFCRVLCKNGDASTLQIYGISSESQLRGDG